MASAGATIWLPDTERFFGELSVIITRAQQQRNLTAVQFDSSEFFVRRLEEYERTLCVQTLRIAKSYGQESCLIGHLHQLLGILNELRCHFEGIAEEAKRDIDSFEEVATPAIVSTARNKGVGRPRLALAQEQLEKEANSHVDSVSPFRSMILSCQWSPYLINIQLRRLLRNPCFVC